MPFNVEPDLLQIDVIATMTEPVLRNLKITQSYYLLSASFGERMGQYANWCTFATWASKQAGQTVRQEDFKRTVENWLKKEPEIEAALSVISALAKRSGAAHEFEQFRHSAIASLASAAANRASDAVSRGNKKVFEEIAREFSRFMSGCFSDITYNEGNIENFCGQLKPGPPPNGQEYLGKAFRCYYEALF